MSDFWYLEGHEAIRTDDITECGASFDDGKARTVARDDDISGVCVSTVFMGIDHSFGDGPPLIFETMVFRGPLDEHQWRYSTWGEAEAGHARVVAAVKGGYDPDDGR